MLSACIFYTSTQKFGFLKFLLQQWTQAPTAAAPSMPGWRPALGSSILRLRTTLGSAPGKLQGQPDCGWQSSGACTSLWSSQPAIGSVEAGLHQVPRFAGLRGVAVRSRDVRFRQGGNGDVGPATDQPTPHPPAGAPAGGLFRARTCFIT